MDGLDHGCQDVQDIIIPLLAVVVDNLAVDVVAVEAVGRVQLSEPVMEPHGVVVKLVLLCFVP